MHKLHCKTCLSRHSWLFTWGGKGLFRKGAVELHITTEFYGPNQRSLDPRDLEFLPESERAEALRELIRYFSGKDQVCLITRPAWLPSDLAALVAEVREEEEMRQVKPKKIDGSQNLTNSRLND